MGTRLDKNSNAVRKRIEEHTFSDEAGEEYGGSKFGGFTDYFRRKKIKLQNLDSEIRASSADKPQIFKGIVAHVTGYTQPSLHVLHTMLVHHGAGFLQYLDSKTMATHIIASSLPPKKMVDFNKYRIVKPAWVTDSIAAGKLLPWSDYRVIGETPRQKTLKLDGSQFMAQSQQSSPLRYKEQTNHSFYTSQLKGFAQALDGKQPSAELPAAGAEGNLEYDDASALDEEPEVDITVDGRDEGSESAANIGDVTPDFRHLAPVAKPDETDPDTSNMTSEEHNAWLLQDPRLRKSSTANPDFIQQYYSESRLHHLSTWKAELKARMQKLAAEKALQGKPPKRKPGSRRYIMHVDFDSFFCAVSLKLAPEYVDQPTVVAHGSGNGSEIASCNYPAREFGVKNGMWMKRAKELCPDLKVLPYNFPAYEEASRLFYESILEVGGVVQSVSIDEALVDTTSVVLDAVGSSGMGVDEGSIWREQEKVDQIASDLRARIKSQTGCAVSVGIGDSILLAKVALRRAKPAGQFQMKAEDVLSILGELKVDNLPGVAYSIAGKLEEIGIKFVSDMRQVSKERLINVLGPKTGEKLYEYARGIDKTEVGDQPIRKSVSAEVNWGIRFLNQEEAEEFVYNLCKELEKRLLNEQVKGKQLTMKIMRRSLDSPLDPAKHLGHGKCDTFNKSTMFGVSTNDAQVLGKEAVSILRSHKFSPGDLRGLGVQLTKLEPLKLSPGGAESSQKKLSFGGFRAPGPAKKAAQDPIQDGVLTSELGNSSSEGRAATEDPIVDDSLTPRKPKRTPTHPALTIAKANAKDIKANSPLNIGGTQFIMPTNPDPAFIAELPSDIRSRLLAQNKAAAPSREASPSDRSRTQSPALMDGIPPDVDPEVFEALPDDVKAEILASYKPRVQQRTPRKDRPAQPSKKPTPTKRRVPGQFARARERNADANARVVQTSFLSTRQANDSGAAGSDVDELDAGFLAELPEEMRKEVIADHRRRKAQRLGLDLKIRDRRKQEAAVDDGSAGQTKLHFTPGPSKIPFTRGGLTSLSEIRDMLNVWFQETLDEGPHRRDVEMLEKYLARVVLEERDMDKVAKLVKWLEYLVEEADGESAGQEPRGRGRVVWVEALRDVKGEVQRAVKQRGLGPLDL